MLTDSLTVPGPGSMWTCSSCRAVIRQPGAGRGTLRQVLPNDKRPPGAGAPWRGVVGATWALPITAQGSQYEWTVP